MLTVKIFKTEARVVPGSLTGTTKTVVAVEVRAWAGAGGKRLEMPISTVLTDDEMATWNLLNSAVEKRLRELIQS